MINLRIGQGYDVHKFAQNRDLILCGVKIPYELGLLGHSDADVALHALCDALLGACAMGDIGKHFPDSDPKYKGIDSMLLLENVRKKLEDNSFFAQNIDLTIIAQKPKLMPYIEQMRENLSKAMCLDLSCVSVKATTTEGLGFEGRGEGISAMAIVLVERK